MSPQYYHRLPVFFEKISLYSIKLCIGITTSMSLALSTCVLFVLLMQSVNEAQYLDNFFPKLFAAAPAAAAVFGLI